MKPGKGLLAVILSIIAVFICVAIFGIGDNSIKGVKNMRYGIDIRGGVEAIFEPQNIERDVTNEELATAREVIEMRLDSLSIADREVTVDKEGGYIIVRFPWKSDETSFNPEDAISELGEMAQLTFRDNQGNVLLQGKNVKKAFAQKDQSGLQQGYVVNLTFDNEGAAIFERVTGELVGKQLGIYMDDDRISNPQVETKISGGQAVINGMRTFNDAKKLADKINSGALPFSLKTTSFSTISPSLGSNALNIMIIAGVLAFTFVCIFMIVYYRLPGVIACVTMTFQIVLQLLALSVPQCTLTLPGIAGIILSLGMAVDANIIISERISEELKKGYSVGGSVVNGYKCAFSSVLDGNITTAIVAIILMLFGSGSMLSFGYTLFIGMIVNVIVGVTISKKIHLSLLTIDTWNNKKWFRKKKDVRVKKFYQKKIVYLIISLVAFMTGIAGCLINGVNLDIQFTGGVVLQYSLDKDVEINGIEDDIESIVNRAVTVQKTKSNVDDSVNLELTLAGNGGISPEEQKAITASIQDNLSESTVELTKTYAVEPYIGAKALKNAGTAIILSFVFILIYVWIRFKSLSGLSAGVTSLIALIHDVLVVFFAFVIFNIPLNDAYVAVILTIIGYSINDTIVVYDRIRENIKSEPDKNLKELVNESISQVLARSVNTSLTTGVCVLMILVVSAIFQINSTLEFSLPMFFGLVSGCYSSVCIASILWAMWEQHKANKRKLATK